MIPFDGNDGSSLGYVCPIRVLTDHRSALWPLKPLHDLCWHVSIGYIKMLTLKWFLNCTHLIGKAVPEVGFHIHDGDAVVGPLRTTNTGHHG